MAHSRKFSGALAVVGFSVVLLFLLLASHISLLDELEFRSWDWRVSLTANANHADSRIKLIVVDQASLDFMEKEYGLTWPIPRDAYKHIISFLSASGARGVAFDLLFTESSAQAVEGDLALAEASAGELPVVHALNLETYEKFIDEGKLEAFLRAQRERAQTRGWGETFLAGVTPRSYRSVTLPIPELIRAGVPLGSVHANPDSDGVFRRTHVGGIYRDAQVLTLPFSLFDQTGSKPGPRFREAVSPDGALVVNLHGGAGSYTAIPFAAVLQAEADRNDNTVPRVPLETFKDSWVLLGATAPGLLDLRPTSLEARGHGVGFLAAVLDNVLHDDFIKVAPLTVNLLAGFLAIAIAVGAALRRTDLRVQTMILFTVSGGYVAASIVLASRGYWLALLAPLFSIALSMFLSVALQYQLEGRRHRFIRRAFQYYVSPSVVDQIVENPDTLAVGGEKRELSILFSDLVGFTSISERLDPVVLVSVLNEYLSIMSEIIQERSGTVDKYVGDAVVAFWNAPVLTPEHALRAVETAIHCQRELAIRAGEFKKTFGIELSARIGINTAFVSVGNFGSRTRFTYTMIGDGANLASRIENINRYFGTRILYTGTTHDQLGGNIQSRKVATIRVRGKQEIVDVFEPSIDETQAVFCHGRLESYLNALEAFELGDILRAKTLFSELTDDPVSEAYLRRIEGHLRLFGKESKYSPIWEFGEK